MIELQNAYEDAVNGKPSRSPLIEMVMILPIELFFQSY